MADIKDITFGLKDEPVFETGSGAVAAPALPGTNLFDPANLTFDLSASLSPKLLSPSIMPEQTLREKFRTAALASPVSTALIDREEDLLNSPIISTIMNLDNIDLDNTLVVPEMGLSSFTQDMGGMETGLSVAIPETLTPGEFYTQLRNEFLADASAWEKFRYHGNQYMRAMPMVAGVITGQATGNFDDGRLVAQTMQAQIDEITNTDSFYEGMIASGGMMTQTYLTVGGAVISDMFGKGDINAGYDAVLDWQATNALADNGDLWMIDRNLWANESWEGAKNGVGWIVGTPGLIADGFGWAGHKVTGVSLYEGSIGSRMGHFIVNRPVDWMERNLAGLPAYEALPEDHRLRGMADSTKASTELATALLVPTKFVGSLLGKLPGAFGRVAANPLVRATPITAMVAPPLVDGFIEGMSGSQESASVTDVNVAEASGLPQTTADQDTAVSAQRRVQASQHAAAGANLPTAGSSTGNDEPGFLSDLFGSKAGKALMGVLGMGVASTFLSGWTKWIANAAIAVFTFKALFNDSASEVSETSTAQPFAGLDSITRALGLSGEGSNQRENNVASAVNPGFGPTP